MDSGFESVLQPLTGTIDTTVLDPNGVTPVTIIDRADPWDIRVRWEVAGTAASTLQDPMRWHVQIFLESIGGGLEDMVQEQFEPVGPAFVNPRTYDRVLTVPAANNAIFAGKNFNAGPYKLTTVITIEQAGTPIPIAAYQEGPMLQFYDS